MHVPAYERLCMRASERACVRARVSMFGGEGQGKGEVEGGTKGGMEGEGGEGRGGEGRRERERVCVRVLFAENVGQPWMHAVARLAVWHRCDELTRSACFVRATRGTEKMWSGLTVHTQQKEGKKHGA